MPFQVLPVVCGPIGTDSYIIKNGKSALVVDPADAQTIIQALDEAGLSCEAVLLTHGHFDHITGADGLRARYDCPAVIGVDDATLLGDATLNCSLGFYGYAETAAPAEVTVKDGDVLSYAGLEFSVLATPGHTRGGVSYVFPGAVFSGDTLFYRGIGRTDLIGGNLAQLRASIKKLYSLPDETTVYSGHNKPTTIGYESVNNPYVRREHDPS